MTLLEYIYVSLGVDRSDYYNNVREIETTIKSLDNLELLELISTFLEKELK